MNYLWVSLGGIIGACARYFLFTVMQHHHLSSPMATFTVNVTGCVVAGVIAEIFAIKGHFSPEWRLFFFTGVLGAFTTFSAFAVDATTLIEKHEYLKSLI